MSDGQKEKRRRGFPQMRTQLEEPPAPSALAAGGKLGLATSPRLLLPPCSAPGRQQDVTQSPVHLFDEPERSVRDEEGEREEDDAGDDHHPGESPQWQLASKQDSIQISKGLKLKYCKALEAGHPKFGVSA